MIQLFTEQIEITKFNNKFSEKILNGEICDFEFNLAEDITLLIIQCLKNDPSSRPNFKNIVETLEKIYQNNISFKSEEFDKYKNYLDKEEIIEIIVENNLQIKKYKEEADKGEPLTMYLYGKTKYEGVKCIMDKKIGLKFLSLTAILKNKEAINYFEAIELEKKLLNKKNENSKEERSNSFDESSSQKSESIKNKEKMPKMKNDSKNMKIKLLHEDKFFDQDQNEEEISKIIERVHNNFKELNILTIKKI